MSSRSCIILILYLKILCVTCKGNSSLTFVIDDTYSMTDDIDEVIRGSRDLLDFVLKTKSSEIEDLILVTFNDPDVVLRAKTNSKTEFIRALERIHVHGNKNVDCPEYSMKGIIEALEKSRSDSYLYVFTDANAKDYNRVKEVVNLCKKKQSQVIFVLTGKCFYSTIKGYNVYFEIAKACSGSIINIGTHEVHLAVDMIKHIVDDKKTIVSMTTVKTSLIFQPVLFTLDEKIEYAIITVSGPDVQFHIKKSNNLNEYLQIEKIMETQNFKVVKLVNKNPGTYKAFVKGNGEVSIVVYGKTDLTFEYGFSEFVPKSLAGTCKQHTAGKKIYLSMSVSDPQHEVNIEKATILSTDEKVLKELSLQKIGTDFYITDRFLSPQTTFKVAVKGTIIKTGKPIVRISKISVQPKPPDSKIPSVTIKEGSKIEVNYGSNISLTCEVSAYPKPKIQWVDSDRNMLKSRSSMIEFPYQYISNLKMNNIKRSKSFICEASNILRTTRNSIQINVISPLKRIVTLPAVTRAEYGKELKLKCLIHSTYPTETQWYFNRTQDKLSISADGSELTIKEMDIELEGHYTCKVFVKHDPKIAEVQTTLVKIHNLAPPKLTSSKEILNKTFIARCVITRGVPRPVVTWKFKGDSGEFTDLGVKGEILTINNIQRQHNGSYLCIGKNAIGTDRAILSLEVKESPEIVTEKTEYHGVVGDKILVISCNATGYPDPTIVWKNSNNEIIKAGSKYMIKGRSNIQSLYIVNPIENDTGKVICQAQNKAGTTTKTFDILVVTDVTGDLGNKHNVYILENESKEINCTLRDFDHSLRWYKNGYLTNITGTTYFIKKATVLDDGNYTCRANTDTGSVSETFVVDVGYKPMFEDNEEPISWFGGEDGVVVCIVRAKPAAKVEWLVDGERSNIKEFKHRIYGWGKYTCKVTNVHGVVEKDFTVTTPGCLINRTMEEKNNPPFILNTNIDVDYDEPMLNNNKFMFIDQGHQMKLTCYTAGKNTFNLFPDKETIIAECDKEDKFNIEGKTYKYSDLKCKKPLVPMLKPTKKSCINVNSKIIKVGFEVPHFAEVYEICYDNKLSQPNFGYLKLAQYNLGNQAKKWTGKFPPDAVRGIDYCDNESKCCYGKGQLVNAADVDIGPPQFAPFIDLNAISVWKPCEKENRMTWSNLEEAVRSLLLSYSTIQVWSGANGYENVNVRRLPRYLWKVLKVNEDIIAIIVYVNTPNPKAEDIKCKKPQEILQKLEIGDDPFTYLCSLEEFSKAFAVPMDTFNRNIL